MNKQRKVIITTTYNEMGIIIDTKAEEVAQPNLQQTCNNLATDCISRQAAINALDNRFKQHLLKNRFGSFEEADGETKWFCDGIMESIGAVMDLPAAQPEIIRCKDCKDFRRWIDTDTTFCDLTDGIVCEDDFCSRAERRTDG